MIRLTDDRLGVGGIALGAIWIGDSGDEVNSLQMSDAGIGATLNVAQDMHSRHGWWNGVEAMHVGLIDGPGNEDAAYCAAVLALHALLKRHNVLVFCHSGGRALAVAVMYLRACGGRDWDWWLGMLSERGDVSLPSVNQVHRDAFEQLDWKLLSRLIRGSA